LDCSPSNWERELGYTVVKQAIMELSTRGTVRSDNWYVGLPEQAMARSYHTLGCGGTPLSQNPVLERDDYRLFRI
ncbi:MAG: hypothetical protein J3R72DRAFT_375261, partial [Linnemannia gamsii]